MKFIKDYARFENLDRFRQQLPQGDEQEITAIEEPPF
jgi:hypothetical protein